MHRNIITNQLQTLRNEFVKHNFDIRLVGGCVRDIIAGHTPKDVDLCTNADPDEQIKIYTQAGIRFVPTGYDHGTITVVLDGVPYEITSLRLDVATDGRRATVAYTRDWLADLERRDLTINAMSMTFDGVLIDPFDGAEHLKAGVVQFVGNAEQRIQEDYLRILRWFRFQARFGDPGNIRNPASPGWRAITKHKMGLSQISAERVWSEIKAILKHEHGSKMLHAMSWADINVPINMPSHLCSNGSNGFFAMENARAWTSAPEVLMAAWTGWNDEQIKKLSHNWRWSSDESKHALWLLKHGWKNLDLRKLVAVHNSPREWVRELAHWEERDDWEKNALVYWEFPPFPVNGNDIIALGVKPGKIMTVIINTLKEEWAASGYSATKEDLLQMVIKMGHGA